MSAPAWRGGVGVAVKRAIAQALYTLGLLQLWQSVVLRRRAVVLMYHRVLTPEQRDAAGSHPAMVVSREAFEMQMAVLRRRFVPLSIAAFHDRIASRRPFADSSCLITFDDGWRDNVENALPALRRHGLPALIFLPVNFIGSTRVFWQEALAHLLRRAQREVADPGRRAALATRVAPVGLAHLLEPGAGADPMTLFRGIDGLKTRSRAEITGLVEGLAADLGVPLDALACTDGFMTWEQAGEIAAQGVDFGGHGVEHHLLTLVPEDVVASEATGSRAVLAQRDGRPPVAFSYPNGYVNDRVVDIVKGAGYQLGFITRRGHVSCDDDPMLIRRLNIHEAMTDTPAMFLARLVGLW